MRLYVFAILLLAASVNSNAQFSRIDVNDIDLRSADNSWATGENDFVVLADNELFVLKYSELTGVSYEKIENMITEVDRLVFYDRDEDGKLDLHVFAFGGDDYHVYLRRGDGYEYAPSYNFNSNAPHNLHFQDFDGDDMDEVMISHGIYTYPELERIWRYPLLNDYQYGLVDFVDYDMDGDKDVLFHQVNRIHLLENTGADFSTTNVTIPETDNSTSWLRKIKTENGDKYLYYKFSGNDMGIYELSFQSGGAYIIEYKLQVELAQSDKSPIVADLDADGNEEIITKNNAFSNNVEVIFYDPSSQTLSRKTFNTGNIRTIGVNSYNNQSAVVVGGEESIVWYALDANNEFMQVQTEQLNILPTANPFVDFDGDGNVDVLSYTGAGIDEPLKRYIGDGNFEGIRNISLPEGTGSLRDFDDDGDLDFVGETLWFENLDGFSFGDGMPYTVDDPTPDPEIFFTVERLRDDLDGDGDLDILTYNFFGEPLELLENIDNQNFESAVQLADSDDIGGDLVLLEAEDIDADGIKDIVMVAVSGSIWLKGMGDLQFSDPIQIYDGQYKPLSADLADFNQDGYLDLAIGTRDIIAGSAKGETTIYMTDDDGFEPWYTYESGAYHRVIFADLDDDPLEELVVKNTLGLFYLDIDATGSVQPQTIELDNSISNHELVVMDANSDGDQDIMLYRNGDPDIRYYLNNDFENTNGNGCPIGSVFIRSKQQLNDFVEEYGNCTRITGSLFIGNETNDWTDIEEIRGLESIQSITGDLTIRFNNKPEDLLGLSGLETVGGNLLIHQWKGDSFEGLENLSSVGGDFTLSFIQGLSLLKDLRNLESLDNIGGTIEIVNSNIENISTITQSTIDGDLIITSYLDPMFDFEGFEVIDSIKGNLELSGLLASSFSEMSELQYVEGISIADMPWLQNVDIGNTLVEIQGDLGIALNTDYDLTAEFPLLQTVGGDLFLRANRIDGFEQLQSVGENLYIFCHDIGNQCMQMLTDVGVDISSSLENEEDFTHFSGIQEVNGSLGLRGEQIRSLAPFGDLQHINGYLSINGTSITSLNSLSDQLTVEEYISIGRNDNLNLCNHPIVCNHLAAGKSLNIYDNGIACNEIKEIECISNSISGRIYYDLNRNLNWDENEATLPNIRIGFNNDQDSIITSYDGYYVRYLEEGTFLDLNISIPEGWGSDQDQFSIESFVPDDPLNASYDFGMYPLEESRDMVLNVTQGLFLCDREFDLFVDVQNQGSQIELPSIRVQYPEGVVIDTGYMDFTSHDVNSRILTYELDSLYPFFHEQLIIPFVAPSAVNLGDIYATIIELESIQNQEIITKEVTLNEELLCSYDPNDKLVSSSNGTSNLYLNESDELVYTIRFQNTGNYYAETVRIQDTLSTELDLRSFEFISASHPVEIKQNDRVLSFIFNDIMLPDSTRDLAGSQGYVKFKINALDGMELGDMIANTGHIYFDYNEAIVTNTVVSELIDPTSVTDISLNKAERWLVHPNPVNDVLQVTPTSSESMIHRLQVLDTNGKLLKESSRSRFFIKDLKAGYYWIKIQDQYGKEITLPFVKI